jgi:hypothetical protein
MLWSTNSLHNLESLNHICTRLLFFVNVSEVIRIRKNGSVTYRHTSPSKKTSANAVSTKLYLTKFYCDVTGSCLRGKVVIAPDLCTNVLMDLYQEGKRILMYRKCTKRCYGQKEMNAS